MKNEKAKNLIMLHGIILLFSTTGIFSKLAAQQPFLSFKFVLYYGIMICILGVYAILWQQVLKRMSLSVAYMNSSISMFWRILWGVLLFSEHLTPNMILGTIVVMIGICLVVKSDA